MSKYIDSYLASIPAGQRDALLGILNTKRASGEVASTEDLEAELSKLLAGLRNGEDFRPSFSPVHVDEEKPTPIKSADFNSTFQAVATDLGGLYAQLNALDRTAVVHDALRSSQWIQIRDGLNKAAEDLLHHRYLKLHPEWQDIKCCDFWAARTGEPTGQAARIDPDTRYLTAGIKDVRRIEQLRGVTLTSAEVYEISPIEAEGASKDYLPENALDTDPKTMWAHLLLTDKPVQTEWKGTTYYGAMVGYTVIFSNAEFINYLSLLPFAQFPVTLVDLEYRDGETWATVPGFTAQEPTLDWIEVQFSRVQANAVRLIFLQPNFVRNKYLVPRHAFDMSRLWSEVLDEEMLLGIEEEDLTAQQQTEIELNPRFRAYLYALKRMEDRCGQSGLVAGVVEDHENMGRMLEAVTKVVTETRRADGRILQNVVRKESDADTETDSDLLQIDKVEYLFGLRTVRVHDRNYLPIGKYSSPEYVVRANPYEVAVDITESRVALTASEGGTYYECSAEYEIELAPDRKHNILPEGTTNIVDELVEINPQTRLGRLRFNPSGAVQGRSSGKLLVSGTDFSVAGKAITILAGYSPNYRYTFSYTPVAGQDLLDIDSIYNSVPLVDPIVFDHTDSHGCIELPHYPYVAYEIVNNEADWARAFDHALWTYRLSAGDPITVDGISYGTSSSRIYEPLTVLVDGIRAYNITDYRTDEHPGFRNDPEHPATIQYIHVGRKIYFSRPLAGVTIEVLYRWMAQYIKLNIILRGHGFSVNPYSPSISDYKVKVRTGR